MTDESLVYHMMQAPIVIKADQPAMDPLDRELKPSANDGDNSDNSDLDDRLARMRLAPLYCTMHIYCNYVTFC